mmetsp:Transcript_55352/g.108352  ORF Transcript_55352/g.108352 Transcript_55352/m.108352 type:complete len:229 (-) Transcript_55352:490-1176(-)
MYCQNFGSMMMHPYFDPPTSFEGSDVRASPAFHRMQSLYLTALPPKMSRALPMVRSTHPFERRSTRARSSTHRAPPAYVTGIGLHLPKAWTSSSSIPLHNPSTSAAWTKNSTQNSAILFNTDGDRRRSASVCHLFVATCQHNLVPSSNKTIPSDSPLPSFASASPTRTLLQDKSTTSRSLPIRVDRSRSRSKEKSVPPSVNRNEVTITWLAPADSHSSALSETIPPPT